MAAWRIAIRQGTKGRGSCFCFFGGGGVIGAASATCGALGCSSVGHLYPPGPPAAAGAGAAAVSGLTGFTHVDVEALSYPTLDRC